MTYPRAELNAMTRLTADLAQWVDARPKKRHTTIKSALLRYRQLLDSVRPLRLSVPEAIIVVMCCRGETWHPANVARIASHIEAEAPVFGGDGDLGKRIRGWSELELMALVDSIELYEGTTWTTDDSLEQRVIKVGLTQDPRRDRGNQRREV